MPKLRPPVKTFGGKFYLSDWIISHFPDNYENLTYIEPFLGGGSVLLNKIKSRREVAADVDLPVLSVFLSLQNNFEEFIGRLKELEYKEETFKKFQEGILKPSCLDLAIREYVLRRMSRGGMKKSFAWSKRLRGGKPGDLNAWLTALDQLPKIAERIKDLEIVHKSANWVIEDKDEKDTLFYCDPPYLHSTRTSRRVYDCEMTLRDHKELSDKLKNCRGKVIISGYSSPEYDLWFSDWDCVEKSIVNHASQQKTKERKNERLWKNF